MKYLLNFSCIILLICLSSCDKDKFEPDYSGGKATAIMNGDMWVGQGRGFGNVHDIGFDFYFDIYNNFGHLRENLSFQKIPKIVGEYALHNSNKDSLPRCTYYTLSDDGDVLDDIYRVVESESESTITVHSYDESKRLLKGEFRVKLYIDPERQNSTNPDTIIFENGKFEVKIEE